MIEYLRKAITVNWESTAARAEDKLVQRRDNIEKAEELKQE
jgi:hypothetical protein